MTIYQYHIYEIDLTNTIKDEELPENMIQGLVLSPNEMNDVLRTVIVAPLTYCQTCATTPTTFNIKEGVKIRLDQISSISKKRFTSHMGKIESQNIQRIKEVLNEMLIL